MNSKSGFSFLELIVAVAIMAILATIVGVNVIPQLGKSKQTTARTQISNIETALNPKICRALIESITELAEKTNKQVLITTHNPAVLDGIDLNNDNERLFVVNRTDEGLTKTKRIQFKPQNGQVRHKLSELWMRGRLGGIPQNFL